MPEGTTDGWKGKDARRQHLEHLSEVIKMNRNNKE
jgi:hypothetical protein